MESTPQCYVPLSLVRIYRSWDSDSSQCKMGDGTNIVQNYYNNINITRKIQ